jgi:ABC-type multidrug transport system fused ATPase/permease subunit
MREFGRLLRHVAPYSWALFLSVILMVVVGAAHGMVTLLVGQVIGRVLAERARAGYYTAREALTFGRMILRDNAKELYGL